MEKVLLRIAEGEERYNIPHSTLYQMSASGAPGFVRLGRAVRIHAETFEQWLKEQAKAPRNDAA